MSAYLVVRDGRLSVVGKLHQRAQVGAQVGLASNQQHFSVGAEFLNFPFPLRRKTKTSITNAFISVTFDMTAVTWFPLPMQSRQHKGYSHHFLEPLLSERPANKPMFPPWRQWMVCDLLRLSGVSFLSECKAPRGWLTWGPKFTATQRGSCFVYCVNRFPSALAYLIKGLDQSRRSSSETWS